MQEAANEENDHLAWCSKRINELGSHTSYLNPVWYMGSLAIGITAGLIGDRWNLGFLAETENQVVRHLQGHLVELSEQDSKSRAIIDQMIADEAKHATTAVRAGAHKLPEPVRQLMGITSKIMTRVAYHI
jgi:ubiquinone biosynthesis monooxygenase Coq7